MSIVFRNMHEACISSDSLGFRIIVYIVAWPHGNRILFTELLSHNKRHRKCDDTSHAVHVHATVNCFFCCLYLMCCMGLEHCLKGALCSLHLQVQHSCFHSTTPVVIVRLSIVYSTSLHAYFCISFEIVWIEFYFLLCIIILWRTRFVHAHQIWPGVRSGLMFACLFSQQVKLTLLPSNTLTSQPFYI